MTKISSFPTTLLGSVLLGAFTICATACATSPSDGDLGGDGKADGANAYAKLAELGGGIHNVTGPSGVEYSVDLMLGEDPASTVPIVYLSGIAARQGGSAEDPFLDRLQQNGRTVIKLMLPAQGETLANDIANTGGTSIDAGDDDWILPEEQSKSIVDALQGMGVDGRVHMAGVSYGGAISAATKALYPNLVDKVLLMAPHSTPQAQNTALRETNYYLWKNGFTDFFGNHTPGAKDYLISLFPVPPTSLTDHPEEFFEGLYELWYGVDEFPTPQVISNMDDVHVLAVPGDTDGPPELLGPAMENNSKGTYTLAEGHDHQHFITGEAPEYAADWLLSRLSL